MIISRRSPKRATTSLTLSPSPIPYHTHIHNSSKVRDRNHFFPIVRIGGGYAVVVPLRFIGAIQLVSIVLCMAASAEKNFSTRKMARKMATNALRASVSEIRRNDRFDNDDSTRSQTDHHAADPFTTPDPIPHTPQKIFQSAGPESLFSDRSRWGWPCSCCAVAVHWSDSAGLYCTLYGRECRKNFQHPKDSDQCPACPICPFKTPRTSTDSTMMTRRSPKRTTTPLTLSQSPTPYHTHAHNFSKVRDRNHFFPISQTHTPQTLPLSTNLLPPQEPPTKIHLAEESSAPRRGHPSSTLPPSPESFRRFAATAPLPTSPSSFMDPFFTAFAQSRT